MHLHHLRPAASCVPASASLCPSTQLLFWAVYETLVLLHIESITAAALRPLHLTCHKPALSAPRQPTVLVAPVQSNQPSLPPVISRTTTTPAPPIHHIIRHRPSNSSLRFWSCLVWSPFLYLSHLRPPCPLSISLIHPSIILPCSLSSSLFFSSTRSPCNKPPSLVFTPLLFTVALASRAQPPIAPPKSSAKPPRVRRQRPRGGVPPRQGSTSVSLSDLAALPRLLPSTAQPDEHIVASYDISNHGAPAPRRRRQRAQRQHVSS